jgi:hypothetical protein
MPGRCDLMNVPRFNHAAESAGMPNPNLGRTAHAIPR